MADQPVRMMKLINYLRKLKKFFKSQSAAGESTVEYCQGSCGIRCDELFFQLDREKGYGHTAAQKHFALRPNIYI